MTRLQRWLIAAGIILIAPACTRTVTVPGPPVKVSIPVPVPCEPVQVPATERPTAKPGASLNELARIALADRARLMGENTRLRAANANPCPETTP